jgi:hypothetical protein
MKIFSLIAGLLLSVAAFAQIPTSQNIKAQPVGGKGALQIVYYRIDFTQEETDYLRTHTPEMIFSVSEYGKARLEKVNDIDRQSIIDSLMNMNNRLPDFYAARVNGRPEQGVYFLKLTWPNYQYQNGMNNINSMMTLQYNPVLRKLSDLEDITYRGPRFDMTIGAFMPTFGGNISKYLDKGWGTRFDFMIYGRKGWGGGFGTTLVIGKPKMVSPAIPLRYNRSHLITIINGSFGKIFDFKRAGQFAIQFEPGFGITDASIAPNTSADVAVGVGFIPGVTAHYLLPFGPGRMSRQYFLPVAYRQFLSIHVAARQLMFNTEETTGMIYEVGLSYRLMQRPVLNYKPKDPGN